jgi:hypothetical protein
MQEDVETAEVGEWLADAMDAWSKVDPAHRGAVLMDLFDLSKRYVAKGHPASVLPDVVAQIDRKRALSEAYQAAIVFLAATNGQLVRFMDDDAEGDQ